MNSTNIEFVNGHLDILIKWSNYLDTYHKVFSRSSKETPNQWSPSPSSNPNPSLSVDIPYTLRNVSNQGFDFPIIKVLYYIILPECI